jgi:hypothetical protein
LMCRIRAYGFPLRRLASGDARVRSALVDLDSLGEVL